MDDAVGKLVDDDVMENVSGGEEKGGIEHNDAFRRAASPLGFCKDELYPANGNAEGLPIHSAYDLFHARFLCLCEEIPQESVERGSTEMWSDVHSPSVLSSSQW